MRIAIGADHGGYELKELIKKMIVDELGFDLVDFGPETPDSVDYPDFAIPVAEKVAAGEYDRGILICGTGIGMSIAANKVKGIRAALVHDLYSAKATREHNDSNILTMGGRIVGPEIAREIARIWLTTPFTGGRHTRRLDKIKAVEERYC